MSTCAWGGKEGKEELKDGYPSIVEHDSDSDIHHQQQVPDPEGDPENER